MEIKKKGVKKAQQREASNNYYLWYTHIHIHIQTERQGQSFSLGGFTRNPAILQKDCPFLRCQEHAVPPCVA